MATHTGLVLSGNVQRFVICFGATELELELRILVGGEQYTAIFIYNYTVLSSKMHDRLKVNSLKLKKLLSEHIHSPFY